MVKAGRPVRVKGNGGRSGSPIKVLVIDVGGTNVKVLATGHAAPRRIPSGPAMTAGNMVQAVKQATADWTYDAVAIGYPGPVRDGRPVAEPKNLGGGWVKYSFRRAFGVPVKVVNDAAMQALGSYEGGRMLFLGLGTGLGSTLITDGVLVPMELAHLRYRKGRTYEDYVGLRGLKRQGKKNGAGTCSMWCRGFGRRSSRTTWCSAAATRREWGRCRSEPASATIAMRLSAAFACGKRPGRMSGRRVWCKRGRRKAVEDHLEWAE